MSYNSEIKSEMIDNLRVKPRAILNILNHAYINMKYMTSNKEISDYLEEIFLSRGVEYKLSTLKKFDRELYVIKFDKLKDEEVSKIEKFKALILLSSTFNSPAKSPRLEINSDSEYVKELLEELREEYGWKFSTSKRRGKNYYFTKEVDTISEIIYICCGINRSNQLDNIKILNSFTRNINQQINFEVSNQQKINKSSSRYIGMIDYIRENMDISNLDDSLIEIIKLRCDHPEVSIAELGKLTSENMSKDRVYSYLKRIEKLYDKIRRNSWTLFIYTFILNIAC